MKEKTRKIFIMIVMAALIVSLMAASFAALTYGRYAGGRRDENSPYEDYIDFVGATAYEVRTPEQFVNAINNGYSYIKIAADAEKPFVVNNNIANVFTNLVIDVNGNTVIRNSRNPVLDVSSNISVVLVYDSSKDAAGGFYNPVGSALQTSGGSLTVGSGVYESGPKSSVTSTLPTAGSAYLVTRTDRKSTYGSASQVTDLPLISEPAERAIGDVYLETTPTGYNSLITADTYLLYTEVKNAFVGKGETSGDATFKSGQLYINCEKFTVEGDTETTTYSADAFNPVCNVASCDFYYYYPVGGTESEDGFQSYAVIYGYNDVKTLAKDCTDTSTDLSKKGLVWPYAAIRSEDGNTHARGGTFNNNFGTQNTYGIYSEGGEMTVGTDSANSAPSFTATGAGVCIRMTEGENNTLTISSGSFSSEKGDTIQMEGGTMTVTAGMFTKSRGKGIGSGDNAQITNQTAIIDIQGGTLTINGAAANSVTLTAGSADTDNGGTLENVFGILAHGGGEVSVGGCTLNIFGDYSAGVLSYDGTINLNDKTVINVTQSDINKDNNNNTLLTSAGVSSEQGEVGDNPVNLTGNVSITSNGLGITARGAVNVTGGESTVTTSRGTGIYVNNGSFTVDSMAKITVKSTVKSGYSWATPPGTGPINAPNIYNGVYVQGGSLISNGTLNVTFTGVKNDSQYIDASGAAVENVQAINNIHHYDNYDPAWENWRDDLDYEHTSDISSYTTAAGIIEANGNLYQRFQTKSYAVRVQNGDVNIKSGLILNGAESDLDENGNIIGNHGIGGGIIVDGGSVTLGEDNGGLRVITTGARMIERQYYWEDNSVTTSEWIRDSILVWEGQSVTRHDYNVTTRNYIKVPGAYQNWAYREPETGGDAVKVIGGQVTVESGHYEAAQGNGILVSGATTTAREYAVEISGGVFVGNDTYDAYGEAEGTAMPGAGASYGLKMYGGSVQITGGRFGSDSTRGSGAFIMGSAAGTQRDATAYITGGTFNVPQGTAGLSVWYGAGVQIEGGTFYGRSAGMTVEDYNNPKYGIIVGSDNAYTTIYIGDSITGNTFDGRQDDIWHGGRDTTLSVPRDVIRDIATANGAEVSTR